MLAKAELRYVRESPSKTRLVTDLVKGKSVEEAGYILDNVKKRAGKVIKKVLDSAFANLNHHRQDKFTAKDVYISKIKSEGGPFFVRYRAATMGRATPVRHRTAHIKVELDKIEKIEKKSKSKEKAENK